MDLLLSEFVRVVTGLAAGRLLAIAREWQHSRRAPVGELIDAVKVLLSFMAGAIMATRYERKRREQDRRALVELQRGLDEDVLQVLAQWGAQGQLRVERDERTGEIRSVSGPEPTVSPGPPSPGLATD